MSSVPYFRFRLTFTRIHPTCRLTRLPMALSRLIMSIIMPRARLRAQSTVDILAGEWTFRIFKTYESALAGGKDMCRRELKSNFATLITNRVERSIDWVLRLMA